MQGRVLALGFFDGVHEGHATLLRRTAERAREKGLEAAVLTFDVHPDVLVSGQAVALISSPEDRRELIRRGFGIETVLQLHFDRALMQMPWERFLDWVREEYAAAHLVCGHDFTFGWRGEGNPQRLREYCEENGLGCDVMPEVCLDGASVSSTRIRGLLLEGRLEEANRLLGHPHVLTGVVCHGRHLGSTIGFPTANLTFAPGVLVPAHGVYVGRLELEGERERKYAVTNVGVRPTVDDSGAVTVESYIPDYSGDLYGKKVRLEFLAFLRPERRFASLADLQAQIGKDAEKVRSWR
jgi:riboflavin kinase/FMN adenylyltransferase